MSEVKAFTHNNVEVADSTESAERRATVEKAIAAIKRLSPEGCDQLLQMLINKYGDEVLRIIT